MTLLTPRSCTSGFQNGERTNFYCFSFLRFFFKCGSSLKSLLNLSQYCFCFMFWFFLATRHVGS